MVAIPLFAQDFPDAHDGYQRDSISSLRHGMSIGFVGAFSLGILADSYYTWWRDAEYPFHWYTNNWFNGAQLGLDKAGHFFGMYAAYKIVRNILLWGGASPGAALWWAAGIAAFHSLEIEMGDAFTFYGFDYQDLLMGWGGAAYGVLQTEVPFFRNFNFKFSYWSDLGARTPANFVSDYDAMTIWLNANVHNLLPESAAPYWPEFIQVAVGFGLGHNKTRRELVIGFDFNLEAFAPCNDNMLLGQRIVNTLHLPAPAVKFTEGKGPVWYGLHSR
jgi:hypothetical protein